MPSLEFALVDVFADAPLAGNPLAVVDGGEDVPDAVLGRIAREFNQSETTFVQAPTREGATRRLRSFTAAGAKVTGVGHNSLGAWWWLVATGRERIGALTQELGGEILGVDVRRDGGRLHVALRQGRPAVRGEVDARSELAGPLGVDPARLAEGPARVVTTGAPHLLVEAVDRDAVDAARPDPAPLAAALARAGGQGCYLFTADGAAAYARFFNPTVGLWEDPATGSAAGPLAWWLTAREGGGARTVEIEQGHAMGRPSRISVVVEGDEVTLVGSAALAGEGRLHLDVG